MDSVRTLTDTDEKKTGIPPSPSFAWNDSCVKGYQSWQNRKADHKECCQRIQLPLSMTRPTLIQETTVLDSKTPTKSSSSAIKRIHFTSNASWSSSRILRGALPGMPKRPVIVGINWSNSRLIGLGWVGHVPNIKSMEARPDFDEMDLFWHSDIGRSTAPNTMAPLLEKLDTAPKTCVAVASPSVHFLDPRGHNHCRRHSFHTVIHVPTPRFNFMTQPQEECVYRAFCALRIVVEQSRATFVVIPLGRLERESVDPDLVARALQTQFLDFVQMSSEPREVELMFSIESPPKRKNMRVWKDHLEYLLVSRMKLQLRTK